MDVPPKTPVWDFDVPHLGTDRAGHLCGKDADFEILPQSR